MKKLTITNPLAIHAAIKGIKTISCRPISISDGDTFQMK